MRSYTLAVAIAVCLGVAVIAATAACSTLGTSGGGSPDGGSTGAGQRSAPGGSPGVGPGTMMGGGSNTASYLSPGQRIWLTGVGIDGRAVARTAPRISQGSLMMGGGGCGSCHGRSGQGGTIRMMTGTPIVAPDITYAVLIKAGFTEETIRRAIRDGLDEAGKPLKDAMPRWRMSAADLDATIAYMKELSSHS